MAATTAWRGTVVALAVFVLLASGDMVRSAEGMPLGWQRTVAVAAARSVDRIANFTSLNRPYDWAAARLGREQDDEDFEFPEPAVEVAQEVDTTVRGESPPTSPPPTTTTTLPPVRVPTAEAPLRVVVAGDSAAQALGHALQRSTGDRPEVSITVKAEISTGLARSDYFNWGARMAEILRDDSPEVVLFSVGANDGQSIIEGDGTVVALFGDPDWEAEYRRRVAGMMDLSREEPTRFIWVNSPRVGSGTVREAIEIGNRLAEQESAGRPWVSYFDLAALVADPDGGSSEFIRFPDGSTGRCLAGDGVHLTVRCLDHVMGELVPTIARLYEQDVEAGQPVGVDQGAGS